MVDSFLILITSESIPNLHQISLLARNVCGPYIPEGIRKIVWKNKNL